MRVKLYNLTILPDQPLAALLQMAAVAAHAKGPIVTRVTRGGYRSRSTAHRAVLVYRSALERRSHTKAGDLRQGVVRTNDGWVEIRMQRAWDAKGTDWLRVMERLWDAAVHEYAHIHDYQKGRRFCDYRRRWANRPHERRAIHAVTAANRSLTRDDAREKLIRRNDLILELAIAAEDAEKRSRGR